MSLAKKEEVGPATRSSAAAADMQPCFVPTSSLVQNAGNDLGGPPPPPSLLLHVGGPRLDCLLESLHSALKKEIGGDKSESIPSKEFARKCKAYICIGVNNVTRTLERMQYACTSSIVKWEGDKEVQQDARRARSPKGGKTISLQAVLVAADAHPRLLAGHLPGLAARRKVPCITVSGGNGTGSVRLGEILNLRTAIAIGLKQAWR